MIRALLTLPLLLILALLASLLIFPGKVGDFLSSNSDTGSATATQVLPAPPPISPQPAAVAPPPKALPVTPAPKAVKNSKPTTPARR